MIVRFAVPFGVMRKAVTGAAVDQAVKALAEALKGGPAGEDRGVRRRGPQGRGGVRRAREGRRGPDSEAPQGHRPRGCALVGQQRGPDSSYTSQ